MKQFIVDRHTTPNTPTLVQVPTEKIPVYDDLDTATADLANLTVGQIVATKDTGTELSQPVDVVEEDNLHAVTSSAVNNAISTTDEEEQCGDYFNNQRYKKTYVFTNVNLVANQSYVLSSSFEVLRNKTVRVNAFIINNDVWSNDVKVFILSDGTLAISSSLGGNNFSVVLELFYIK